MSKRITINKPHFKFFYILPGVVGEPFAIADGNEPIKPVPPDEFSKIVKKEGSQALATAINIGRKNTNGLKKAAKQARMLNGNGPEGP